MELEKELIAEAPVHKMLLAKNNIKSPFHDMLRAKEIEKVVPELMKVEQAFIEHINAEDLEYDYMTIFNHFNAEYLRASRYCIKKFNLKHVMIYPHYFRDKFQSKES